MPGVGLSAMWERVLEGQTIQQFPAQRRKIAAYGERKIG